MIHNPHMLPKVRSPALLSAIAGMPCSLRLAGFAGRPCAPVDTVVGCHLPVFGKGVGTKVSDLFVVAGCSTCHDLLDARNVEGLKLRELYPCAWTDRLLKALAETQARWVQMGVLVIPEAELV